MKCCWEVTRHETEGKGNLHAVQARQADQSTGTWNSCYFRRTVERNAWNLVFTVLEDVAGHTVENRRAILIARKGL